MTSSLTSASLRAAGKLHQCEQLVERKVGLEGIEGVEHRGEVDIGVGVHEARDEIHDDFLLAAHPAVVLVDARAHVAEGLLGVECLRASLEVEVDHRVDEWCLGRDFHPIDRVDQRNEVVHVEQDVAVDLDLVERLHGSDQRVHPLVGVETVDLAGIRRPVGERHVDDVTRKRHE